MPPPTAISNPDDVQGLALSSYGELDYATFVLLRAPEGSHFKQWLAELEVSLTTGQPTRDDIQSAANVAFSHSGLQRLGLEQRALNEFSPPFREGMAGALNRSWGLGDVEDSAPENWVWGKSKGNVDAAVLLYHRKKDPLAAIVAAQVAAAERHGLERVGKPLVSQWPGRAATDKEKRREHFGFLDGLSQPSFEDIALGELLLGYPNEDRRLTLGPTVARSSKAENAGLPRVSGRNSCDFGFNGSYLVFRQLAQDVLGFWEFAEAHADIVGSTDMCAAKMVGRWRNGAPLTLAPNGPTLPRGVTNADPFLHREHNDGAGESCPLGSHVRRVNPRDTLPGMDSRASLKEVRRHRILRRGRAYGAPVPGWPDPQQMLASRGQGGSGGERGLHFLCLNADIARQFEHVQQQWVNNPNFVSRPNDEVDPMLGRPSARSRFLIPKKPAPVLLGEHGVPCRSFVTVRGGEYFFLPSVSAIRYLIHIDS